MDNSNNKPVINSSRSHISQLSHLNVGDKTTDELAMNKSYDPPANPSILKHKSVSYTTSLGGLTESTSSENGLRKSCSVVKTRKRMSKFNKSLVKTKP